MNYSYERDKKFGNACEPKMLDGDGNELGWCVGCLSYEAGLFHDFPEHEDYKDYDEEYDDYMKLINDGHYPVDGSYSGLYLGLLCEWCEKEKI